MMTRPVVSGLPAPWRGLDRGLMSGGSSTWELLGPCEPLGRELDARIERVREGAGMAERSRESLRGGVEALRGKADGIAAASRTHTGSTARDREPLEHQQALVAAVRKDAAALTRDIDTLDAQLQAGVAERVAASLREDCRPVLGPRQAALHQELARRALVYGRVLEQLRPMRQDLQQARRHLDAMGPEIDGKLEKIRIRLAQQLELAVTASFGFWTTVGMLAMWSLLDRGGKAGHHA